MNMEERRGFSDPLLALAASFEREPRDAGPLTAQALRDADTGHFRALPSVEDPSEVLAAAHIVRSRSTS